MGISNKPSLVLSIFQKFETVAEPLKNLWTTRSAGLADLRQHETRDTQEQEKTAHVRHGCKKRTGGHGGIKLEAP